MRKIGLYAGSFDPITNGHLDIIKRASRLFDVLYVVIMNNTRKQYTFSFEQKQQLASKAIQTLRQDNIQVLARPEQLVAQVAQQLSARWLVRGVRTAEDLNYEIGMQQINQLQSSDLETVYLVAKPQYMYVSSSMVKEVVTYGGQVKGLVPLEVEQALVDKLR
ncbi:pantetheine-phosphate adenylyltransferase [Bombilactobacillus folatiphilus]|uniref:Phosphopantetheine adenylyltransferase n=1 Tax=Bombilactobacillus folatiphilus TaxID=2923362 RepID=A0ABY4PAS2_9LACO|nr:pantetheine-phosphate adenylyltransferase [Bombilactobacillus folatiphilus]UQS82739.1 pantetheine-phosphate adenylyltransferase [Bombilactobacillus folatiphilus]